MEFRYQPKSFQGAGISALLLIVALLYLRYRFPVFFQGPLDGTPIAMVAQRGLAVLVDRRLDPSGFLLAVSYSVLVACMLHSVLSLGRLPSQESRGFVSYGGSNLLPTSLLTAAMVWPAYWGHYFLDVVPILAGAAILNRAMQLKIRSAGRESPSTSAMQIAYYLAIICVQASYVALALCLVQFGLVGGS